MVWLQDFILKHLHRHTFSNMLSDGISKAHCAQISSCFGSGASVWFTIQLIFLGFWLISLVFSTTLQIWLGLSHPLIVGIPWCTCTYPINLWVSTSYVMLMATNTQKLMMQFVTPLLSLCGMLVPCGVKTITFASFKHIQFLSLTSQYCAHQIWHLHFSQHCNCRQHE
jgi:hypothetical protein